MESVFNRVKTFCLAREADYTYWIAYSGGLDSHVLLHACAKISQQYHIKFKAIHINHGLSVNAQQWMAHCENICKSLNIDFFANHISISPNSSESLEALARDLRYQAFSEYLCERDVLLTAHHQDDQAETVFLQLMRGAGLKGLSAMPEIKPFARGFHGRPLLDVSKKSLEAYADKYALTWIEDESNTNVDFSRNFLRHDIFPGMKKRWPAMTETLSRVAQHCADSQTLIDETMDEHLRVLKRGNGLLVSGLLKLSPVVQSHVLRRWFSQLGFPLPSVVKMQQIQQAVLLSAEDKMPHVKWGKIEMRRYQGVVYVMPQILQHDVKQTFVWDLKENLILPNVGVLKAKDMGLKKDIKEVIVRFRQGGEVCRLPGRNIHHELKKLFQLWGVPPWERARVPLLFVGEKLIAVVGYYIDEAYSNVG